MADIKIEKAEDSYFKAIISASFAEVNQYEKKSLDNLREKKQLPGFRKGKAPDSLLKAKFADELKTKTLNLFLDAQIPAIGEKSEFGVYSIDKFNKLEEKNDQFVIEILFSGNPNVTLAKFKDLGLVEDTPLVEESDINSAIERLLRNFATFEPTEQPAVYGCLMEAEHETFIDDIPHGQAELRKFFLGDNYIDETLEKEMIEKGGKIGEEFSHEVVRNLLDNANEKEVEKKVKTILTIKSISAVILPELNDEFIAEKFPDIGTVAKYRENLTEWFEQEFYQTARRKELSQALEKLIQSSTFYFPKVFIKAEAEEYLKQYKISYEQADKKIIENVHQLVENKEKGILVFHKLLALAEDKRKEKDKDYSYKDTFMEFIDKENDAMSANYIKSVYEKAMAKRSFETEEEKKVMDEQLENFHWYLLFEFFRELGFIKKGKAQPYKAYMSEARG